MKKVVAFLIGFFCVALASQPSFASPPANFQRNLIIGTCYTFHNWSDGGEVIHVVTTPPQDATLSYFLVEEFI